VGIVVFLVLPALFFTGLALVPIGVYLSKRQIRRGLSEEGFDRRGRCAASPGFSAPQLS
jgi:hypothetical protein